jgi:squalene-hopene/tetraprenyl-beta-curcumene cyclase
MRTLRTAIPVLAALISLWCLADGSARTETKSGPDPKVWDETVDKGIAFLRSKQADDGTWSKESSPAVTGIVLIGLFKTGKVTANDQAAARGLKFLETLIDPKEGHISGAGSKKGLLNYGTSVNAMAFKASGNTKYDATIAKAVAFLKDLQWDEGEGKSPKDDIYGGAGYGGGSRPDLSNTHFFLDALTAAGVPRDDPAFKKAVIYVSRCQNLKGEANDQPWAGKINDGSFIYGAGPAGETRGDPGSDGARPGYGSMTYAGIKALLQCGVSKDDVRIKKALEWVSKHYTVDANPGMPANAVKRGHYYYLMTMARCLDALGIDEIIDAEGKKHDWRAEITGALAALQRKDGSWVNETTAWMEGNPDLCTAYALITLGYCKPKMK